MSLFNSYMKVIWRSIRKHKGYSFINITGLAIGLACCLLISIWVLDELSYDRFHENADSLYRVEENQYYQQGEYHVTVTPYPIAPALVEEIAGIKDATRYVWPGSQLFRFGEKGFYEYNVRAVDPSFFRMFTFPLIKGDKDRILDSPYSLVISEDMAEKYFGRSDPLGKVLTVNGQYEFTVTGVMKNIPHNSFLQLDMAVPYEFLRKIGATYEAWDSNSIFTFVQLEESAAEAQVNAKIKDFIRTRTAESRTDLVLFPYTKIHLHAYFGFGRDPGAVQYVYIFSIIAFFVLLIACINFMNLSTARSATRAKEVGLRKVVGALKGNLVRQFYGESIVFAFVALVLAVVLVAFLLPAFSEFTAKDLSWNIPGADRVVLGLIAVALFTGMVSGSYPALLLSSFQPAKVLHGPLKAGAGSSRFRKILVVVQFALSVILIIGTLVVYKQLNYMQSKKLGWDKEHMIYFPLRKEVKKSYAVLKNELAKDSHVLGVTASGHLPTHIGSNSGGADWEGKDPELQVLIGTNVVDFDFIETLGIEMTEGRSFSRDHSQDFGKTFIVNEEVAELMGKEKATGERFRFFGVEGTIIGVMKNFHFKPVREKIEPLAFIVNQEHANFALVRISSGDIRGSLASVKKIWRRIIPDYPFEYFFLDERFDRMYRSEERIGVIVKYFAFLAVFIACLGLFGLASFTAEKRTREVGIRKVLGASVGNITVLLCREFMMLVLLANAIAWPVAYFVMSQWLQGYAYRTRLGVVSFVAALGAAAAVALLSVIFQALRAAVSNPAQSLRYE